MPRAVRALGTKWPYREDVGRGAGARRRNLPGNGPVAQPGHLRRGGRWAGLSGLRELGLAIMTLGAVVLLFVVYELVGTNLSEEQSQARLSREFGSALAQSPPSTVPPSTVPPSTVSPSTVPSSTGAPSTVPPKRAPSATVRHGVPGKTATAIVYPPAPPPGGAVDHLVIPAIGVDRYVVQGVAEGDLQMGPGHYPGTPLPGHAGNAAIAGHRTTFGAPFFRLNELVPGDLVYLTDTAGTTWVYRVVHMWVVAPTDVAVLGATRDAALTLTTCNPRFEATSRLVVRALLAQHLAPGSRLPQRLPTHGQVRLVPAPARPAVTVTVPAKATTSSPGSSSPATTSRGTTSPGSARPKRTSPSTSGAVPSGTAAASPATTSPSGQTGADTPTVGPPPGALVTGTGGTSAWLGTAGWGLLAVLGWLATRLVAARRYRFAKAGVLLAGALACLVPLWFSFENLVNLLPANI